MASIPSGKSTLSDGKVPQPWWWWTWCTGWRLPHDHWPDSWGLLSTENASELGKVESMDIPDTLGRNDGKHCRKSACLPWLFRKKMTCRAGFWSVLEANPSGIKKREAPKNKVEGKKTKQTPSILPCGAQMDSWQFGRTLPSVHSHSQRSNHLTSTSSKSWNNI